MLDKISSIRRKVREYRLILYSVLSLYLGGLISMMSDSLFSSYETEVSLNLIKAIMYNLKNPLGIIVTGSLFFIIYAIGEKNKRKEQKAFNYSEKGTHGTAGLMTDDELKHYLKETDKIEQTSGTIIGERNGKVISLKSYQELEGMYKDYALNNFISVAGGPGKGKTQAFGLPYIFKVIEREESAFIFDTKGDYYAQTSNLAIKKGFTVKRISFKPENFRNSDAWDMFAYIKIEDENVAELRVEEIITILMKTTEDSSGKGSQFFTDGLKNLLSAGFLYVARSPSYKGERTIGACFNLLVETTFEKLNSIFSTLPSDDPAVRPWATFARTEKVATDVLTNLGTRLAILKSRAVQEILSRDEIDIELVGKQKCIYYVIIDDQSTSFKPIVSIFAKTVIKRLVVYADSQTPQRLKIPVTLYMEEFPSSVKIPEFEASVATIRSRGIGVVLVYQNLAQMKNKFPDNEWEAMLNNCDININLGLGANDMTTAKFLEERSGVATTTTISTGEKKNKLTPQIVPILEYQSNNSEGRRNVMNADEILRMPPDELLLIISGHNACKLKKIKAEQHLINKELEAAGRADIYQYVPKWRKEQEERKIIQKQKLEEMQKEIEEKNERQKEFEKTHKEKDVGDKIFVINTDTGEVVEEKIKTKDNSSQEERNILFDLLGEELREEDFKAPKKRGRKPKAKAEEKKKDGGEKDD